MAAAVCAAGLAIAGFAAVTVATEDAAQLVQKRIELMKVNGKHLGVIVSYVKGKTPFSPDLAAAAQSVSDYAKSMPALFPPGSVTPTSRAKPEIWQNFEDFKVKAKALETATAELAEILKKDDPAAVQAQLRKVGNACGGCHTVYRSGAAG
ncbi:MAG TPA: cytochrome c [Candidatus Sulfotelmatobacter sp.]|nr:cytochrome c [Candidatus Sulfotelmatobacter sp.]